MHFGKDFPESLTKFHSIATIHQGFLKINLSKEVLVPDPLAMRPVPPKVKTTPKVSTPPIPQHLPPGLGDPPVFVLTDELVPLIKFHADPFHLQRSDM